MKFRFTIGAKLISLIAVLLMAAVSTLITISTHLFVQDNVALIQQMNADTAAALARQVQESLDSLTEKMRFVGTVLLRPTLGKEGREALLADLCARDNDLLGVFIHELTDSGSKVGESWACPELISEGDKDGVQAFSLLERDKHFSWSGLKKGEVQISAVRLSDGKPGLLLAIPFLKRSDADGHFTHALTTLVRQVRIGRIFGDSDISENFLVDKYGRYLASPDPSSVIGREPATYLDIVKQLLEGSFNNGQTRYVDPLSDEPKLGAFRRVGFGGLAVVTEVPEAKAFEAAHRVEYRSLLVALTVLCLSFLGGYWYSGSITWPLERLVLATRKISAGDFKIRIQPKTRDEVGELSVAFNEMAEGLEERERVKATFEKFHNKEIAEKLLSGEVKLGGERKEATILFTDIRGFTSISESMQPEEVVEMLNEYLTRMVAIIRQYGGIVDKYVGDAIVAVWGVPVGDGEDSYRAVSACLAMRVELEKLNSERLKRQQDSLLMGMGLNSGTVIAGNIGSNEKMEYTVIGDSVNLASRIESMTKAFGTDLLVSQSVRDRLEGRFLFESCYAAFVKGKSLAVETFKVRGYIENGNPVTVSTQYSDYPPEASEKVESTVVSSTTAESDEGKVAA